LRLSEFGELLGRREAFDRRCQHGVRIGVAIGAAIKLRQRQRGAQLEAPRFLRLRDRNRGLQRLLGRRGIGRVAFQQDPGPDAVYLRVVPTVLSGLEPSKRVVQASERGSDLASTCLGFGQGRLETGDDVNHPLLPKDGDAASHLGQPRLALAAQPSCPALKKCRDAGQKGWEIVSRYDVGQRLAIGRDRFGFAPYQTQQRPEVVNIGDRWSMRRSLGVGECPEDADLTNGSRNSKFESTPLQQRVNKLSVPGPP